MAADAESTTSRRSFLSVIASAYILNSAGRVADVVWLLLLFTALSVEQVAVFALASAVAAFFSMALDAGLNQTLLREFSAARVTIVRGATIAISVRAVALALAIVAGGLWVAVAKPEHESIAAVVVACAVQLWVLLEQFCQQWMKANDRQTLANTLAALEPFLKLGATAVLMTASEPVTAVEFFVAQNVYHCLLALACVIACARTQPHLQAATAEPLRKILGASSWFALMGLITVAQNRVDWLLVAKFASAPMVASYTLVNRAYEVLMLLIGTGAMTLFPWLCRDSGGRGGGASSSFGKAVLAGGVLSAGLAALVLPAFCAFVWKDKYVGADALLSGLMPIACVSTFIQLMYYQAIAGRAEARVVAIGAVATCIQIAANLLLVPRYGAIGAVWGMLVLAVANVALYWQQRAKLSLSASPDLFRLGGYAAINGLMWFAIAAAGSNVWLQFGVGLSIWAALTYCWLLSTPERTALAAAIGSMRTRLAAAGASSR